MRDNLFLNRRNILSCTAKMMEAVANAVRNAIKLIPSVV